MFCVKLTTFCLLIVACALSVVYATTAAPDPCLAKRKCTTTEKIVYAVDDYQCYLFRNDCLYLNDMCQRRENKENDLQVVSKDECMKKCRNFCTEEYYPLCAEYDSKVETFSNKCEFQRISCQNDKSYMFIHYGACEKA